MPGLASYMAQYDHEHSSVWNKVLHGVGIPMIFAGIILLILTKWIWGAVFFVGGAPGMMPPESWSLSLAPVGLPAES